MSAKSRQIWRRIFQITAGTFVAAFAGWFVFGPHGLWESRALRRETLAQERQLLQLKEERQELDVYLRALQNGDELAMMRAAREHGFVAHDEMMYSVQVDKKTK